MRAAATHLAALVAGLAVGAATNSAGRPDPRGARHAVPTAVTVLPPTLAPATVLRPDSHKRYDLNHDLVSSTQPAAVGACWIVILGDEEGTTQLCCLATE